MVTLLDEDHRRFTVDASDIHIFSSALLDDLFGDFTKAFARNGRLYYEQTENATDKKGKESN